MHFFRIDQQSRFQQKLIARIRAKFFCLFRVSSLVGWVLELALKDGCCSHGRAAPIERTPASVAEPGLIPQKYEIGLDGETLLHYTLHVIDLAIEGTVGEYQHSCAVQLSLGLEVQQGLFNSAQRHGAVHGDLSKRICCDIKGQSADKHRAVVVRFMTIAVYDHDIARREQSLLDHLVGRGGPVRDKEHMICPECAGSQVLRKLDVACGLQ